MDKTVAVIRLAGRNTVTARIIYPLSVVSRSHWTQRPRRGQFLRHVVHQWLSKPIHTCPAMTLRLVQCTGVGAETLNRFRDA